MLLALCKEMHEIIYLPAYKLAFILLHSCREKSAYKHYLLAHAGLINAMSTLKHLVASPMMLLLPGALAFSERRYISAVIMLAAMLAPIFLLYLGLVDTSQFLLVEVSVLLVHLLALTARLAVWNPHA